MIKKLKGIAKTQKIKFDTDVKINVPDIKFNKPSVKYAGLPKGKEVKMPKGKYVLPKDL
jgi:hypothetical protein